jgi:hypothetical protein
MNFNNKDTTDEKYIYKNINCHTNYFLLKS